MPYNANYEVFMFFSVSSVLSVVIFFVVIRSVLDISKYRKICELCKFFPELCNSLYHCTLQVCIKI